MDDNLSQLLDALKAQLHATPFIHDKTGDSAGLFRLAHENGVSGTIFPVLDKERLSDAVHLLFYRDFLAYQKSDIVHEQALIKLKKTFNEAGVTFILLKGAVLKHLYPETYMRPMGDIDVLVKENDIETAEKALLEAGFKAGAKSEQHDQFHLGKNVTIEVHPRLYKAFNVRYESLFESVWDYALPYEKNQMRFTSEFELVYLLYHLAKHFDSSGVGLRSILDIGLYVNAHKDAIDIHKLEKLLNQGAMSRFFSIILALNRRLFDLGGLDFFVEDVPLSEEAFARITDYITTSGIHGKGKGHNRYLAVSVDTATGRQKGRISMLLSILFPPMSAMRGLYPKLKKHNYLIVIFYPHRLIRLSLMKTRTSWFKLKRLLSVKKDDARKTAAIHKELGL